MNILMSLHMLLALLEKSRLMVTFDYFTDESPSLSKVSKFEAEGNGTNPFKWKTVIKAVLRECDGQELPLKRLRKKVLAEFQACGANYTNLSENKIRALFDKKVHSNPNFKVRKDIVRLVK